MLFFYVGTPDAFYVTRTRRTNLLSLRRQQQFLPSLLLSGELGRLECVHGVAVTSRLGTTPSKRYHTYDTVTTGHYE